MTSVELVDLRVVYRAKGEPERVALDGFSLTADREMVALLGPNGAGKSTLMGVIAQTVTPESGQRVSPSSRKELAVVFQTPALDHLLTVRENLMLAGALHGLKKPACRERGAELAAELGIADRLDTQVRRLSGGLARRADLARALMAHPGVLLLDEPTTGLDIDARRSFWEVMRVIRDRLGMTVLLATHLIDEAEQADRVVMMREGRLVKEGEPRALRGLLGERVLRLRLSDEAQLAQASDWLTAMDASFVVADRLIIAPDIDPAVATGCPVAQAAVTIAPPSLEDVYTFFTSGASAEHDAAQGVLA